MKPLDWPQTGKPYVLKHKKNMLFDMFNSNGNGNGNSSGGGRLRIKKKGKKASVKKT